MAQSERGSSTNPAAQTRQNHNPLPTPVAIIGASLTGLSLAISLLQSNLYRPSDITIYDQRRGPGPTAPSSTTNPPVTSNSTPDATSDPQPPSGVDPSTTSSGVVLTPNGLAVLDTLDILRRVKLHCWTSVYRTYRSDTASDGNGRADGGEGRGREGDRLVRKVQISGEEKYGYRNHRLWRSVLVGAMLEMVVGEYGVDVRWGWRFEGVASPPPASSSPSTPAPTPAAAPVLAHDDSATGTGNTQSMGQRQGEVRFLIKTPTGTQETHTAGLLVGADGIYSTVRTHLHPHATPEYTGTTGVLAHIRWDDVSWPLVSDTDHDSEEHAYERQCTLQSTPGALFWIPEDPAGETIMVGRQVALPEGHGYARSDWERLARDKEYLTEFYRRDYGEWGVTGRKVIDAVTSESGRGTLYLWPFMRMASLESWFELQDGASGRDEGNNGGNADSGNENTQSGINGLILLLGDAAHALPPSSGQGVNQTLEDVSVLTRVLGLVPTGEKDLRGALRFWQEKRQERVERVFAWASRGTNVQRLGRAERENMEREGRGEQGAEVQAEANKKGSGNGYGKQEGPVAVDVDDMRWLYQPDWDEVIEAWRTGMHKE